MKQCAICGLVWSDANPPAAPFVGQCPLCAERAARQRAEATVATMRGAMRKVPIVRCLPGSNPRAEFSGYECVGCGRRSGIKLPHGEDVQEQCTETCWVHRVEQALSAPPTAVETYIEAMEEFFRVAGYEPDAVEAARKAVGR